MDIRHAILALLNHEPSYGYQIMGMLAALFGSEWSINSGQIYSTLSRLERNEEVEKLPSGRESKSGRTRYSITDKGKAQLRQWYLEPLTLGSWSRDDIPAKLALSQLSGPVPVEQVIQRQRRKLLSELHDLTTARDRNSLIEFPGRHLYLQSAIMHVEADLRWLDLVEEHLEEIESAPPPTYEPRRRGRPKTDP